MNLDAILATLCVLVLIAIFRVDVIRRWLSKREYLRHLKGREIIDDE